MSEPIWCYVRVRIPPSWGEDNDLINGLSEALINGSGREPDGDQWQFDGEGNYGLYDDEIEYWLRWMLEHKVPYIASSEAKYEFDGETRVFDGTTEWAGTSGADNALLSKQEYDNIIAGQSQFRTIEQFFNILNTSTLQDFPIDHLPAEFPKEEE